MSNHGHDLTTTGTVIPRRASASMVIVSKMLLDLWLEIATQLHYKERSTYYETN